MGPKPTPTAVLEARGSWRAKTRTDEPKPDTPTTLKPPANLPKEARKLWKRLAPVLISAGLLTSADIEAFGHYCRLAVAWDAAMRLVEESPTRENILALAKVNDAVRDLEASFGMTPADRVGLAVTKPVTNNAKARFFNDYETR